VSLNADITFYNIDWKGNKNYLSIGQQALPTVYFCLSLLYVAVTIVWLYDIRNHYESTTRLHLLMTVLLVVKFLDLFAHAFDVHYLSETGHIGAWALIYNVFTFTKGIMFFIVVLLIGTGWSLLKPMLADNERTIVMIVVPLQVLDNIALAIVEDSSPGSKGWFAWKDAFRVVDIICCALVVIPIIWSIRRYKEAPNSDGQAARNADRLQRFQQFYILTMCYLYFTRIIGMQQRWWLSAADLQCCSLLVGRDFAVSLGLAWRL